MKIILVRHGLTQANMKMVYSVDETKLEQSGLYILDRTKELLKNYDIDDVYTSNLYRAKETAAYLGYKDYKSDGRLNEMNFGDFKGRSLLDVRENEEEFFDREKSDYFGIKYPNGESRLDVINRVGDFLEEKSKEDKTILVISHGIAIRSSLFWILKNLDNWPSFWIDNGSLTVYKVEGDKRLIESVNLI